MNKLFGGRDEDDGDYVESQVLVVGEGDFSLTLALCKANRDAHVFDNLWSTTLDSYWKKQMQARHHPNININIRKIGESRKRTKILYEVDATKLHDSEELNESFMTYYFERQVIKYENLANLGIRLRLGNRVEQPLFDIVFFTFPVHYPIAKDIGLNEHLIFHFFRSAAQILQDDGEIRIALQSHQFRDWNVKNFAKLCGLKLTHRSVCYWENLFRPTDGYGGNWNPTNAMWYNFQPV